MNIVPPGTAWRNILFGSLPGSPTLQVVGEISCILFIKKLNLVQFVLEEKRIN